MTNRQPQKWPKDIKYIPIFEPDMGRMVDALRILLEYNPERKNNATYTAQPSKEEKAG
ncbi:hypothetical protein MOTE_23860 [Moorella thermoacetica]|uniref:Uncharacterized protein n=1 Tax=Neomoorella thermoacetica TaxID=1525 RepID=A0A1J5NBE1_NEOTH|nr:hypothetical protein MOTE_23860 [Moorella thermoacetica]